MPPNAIIQTGTRQCGAWADSSNQRCRRRRVLGSLYCWRHQSWGPVWIGILGGLVTAYLIYIGGTKYLEAKQKAAVSINGQRILGDTVLRCPKSSGPQKFVLRLSNLGNTEVRGLFVTLQLPSGASNLVHAPNWLLSHSSGQNVTSLTFVEPRNTPSGKGLELPLIFVDAPNVTVLPFFVWYGANAAKPNQARLRILFDPTAIERKVFYDEMAETIVRSAGAGESSSDLEMARAEITSRTKSMVQRYGPQEEWPNTEP